MYQSLLLKFGIITIFIVRSWSEIYASPNNIHPKVLYANAAEKYLEDMVSKLSHCTVRATAPCDRVMQQVVLQVANIQCPCLPCTHVGSKLKPNICGKRHKIMRRHYKRGWWSGKSSNYRSLFLYNQCKLASHAFGPVCQRSLLMYFSYWWLMKMKGVPICGDACVYDTDFWREAHWLWDSFLGVQGHKDQLPFLDTFFKTVRPRNFKLDRAQ